MRSTHRSERDFAAASSFREHGKATANHVTVGLVVSNGQLYHVRHGYRGRPAVLMSAAIVSRWAQRYVVVSALFLIVWQAGALVGTPRAAEVIVGVFGFVLHMLFGKAYSLVPSYFDRELAAPHALAVQLPLTAGGTVGLFAASLRGFPWAEAAGTLGAILWALGVAVFLGTLLWTIRDNLSGAATGTGGANTHRKPIDRAANAFVPVGLAYLIVGSYEMLAIHTGLPTVLDGYLPRVSHLLAAGTAGMFVFALGFRLLPRFLVATPPMWLVAVVLPTGAVGPVLLATTLGGGRWFVLAAVIETIAVVGFALAYLALFVRTDRHRVGFDGVLAGVCGGVIAVTVGLSFALGYRSLALELVHFRLNVLGFLGLTIVGVAYQFYPPAVGTFPAASDRTALVSIAVLAGGLLVQLAGVLVGVAVLLLIGEFLTLVGAILYTYVLLAVFDAR